MKQQLLKKITDLEYKSPNQFNDDLDNGQYDLGYCLSWEETLRALYQHTRKDTINEIIKLVKETNMPVAKPSKCHWCGA